MGGEGDQHTRCPMVISAPARISGGRGPRAGHQPAGDVGRAPPIIAAIGIVSSPACSALSPRTSCRYRVLRKRKPPSVRERHHADQRGCPRTVRCGSSAVSTSGSHVAAAPATIRTMRGERRATANRAMIGPEPHPLRGPSMIPAVRQPSRAITSTWPRRIQPRRACPARDSGTKLLREHDREQAHRDVDPEDRAPSQRADQQTPPITGPLARLSPATEPHMPIARARLGRGR